MDREAFGPESAGHLVKELSGYWAFVPNALEPVIALDLPLVNLLSKADRALSELSGMARTLPNPHLLLKSFIRREALLSSRIEGTRATLEDLLMYEVSKGKPAIANDAEEVANYIRALEHGLARLPELPLSLRLLREIHAELMVGVRGGHLTPGEFRRSQNWIGPPGSTLSSASYVPPPVAEMHRLLGELESYLHRESSYPPLLKLALVHQHFEAIHPFLDGNGRVGRLLITLMMCTEGFLDQPVLSLSAFFEQNRPEYYQRLLSVSQAGDWRGWIAFFLLAVLEQSDDARKRLTSLQLLWTNYREMLLQKKSSVLALQLVDQLFNHPSLTVAKAAELLDVTPRSAQLNIDKLVAVGILKESTGKQRNRVYLAHEIVAIIE